MSTEINQINFGLAGVSTRQFALISEPPDSNFGIQEKVEFALGASPEESVVTCLFHYSLLEDNRPFLTIEVSCDFNILESDWKKLENIENKKLTLPIDFVRHLANITVGTTRGILHSKTENTPFNKYPVGILDLKTIFTNDTSIEI